MPPSLAPNSDSTSPRPAVSAFCVARPPVTRLATLLSALPLYFPASSVRTSCWLPSLVEAVLITALTSVGTIPPSAFWVAPLDSPTRSDAFPMTSGVRYPLTRSTKSIATVHLLPLTAPQVFPQGRRTEP